MSEVNSENASVQTDSSNPAESTQENNESSSASPAEDSAEIGSTEDIDSAVDEMLGEDEESAESDKKDKKQTKEEKRAEALKKKLKLKVNGKELEEEIDFNDDARLTKALQKEKAFDAASQELSTLKKQFSGLVEALKGDQVLDVLRQLGHDVDSLAEKHLTALVEEAKKSPEQLKQEQMEKELKSLKEEKERLAKEKKDRELEAMRNQYAQEIENDISTALESVETILPKKNPKIIRSIAQNMLFAMKNGYPEVTAKEIIPIVEAEYKRDLKELFDVLPEDTIEALVGKNNFDRVRAKKIAAKKATTKTANQIVKETGKTKETDENSQNARKKSYRDFFS